MLDHLKSSGSNLKLSETRDNNYVTLIGLIRIVSPKMQKISAVEKTAILARWRGYLLQQLHQLEEEPVPAALLGADKLKPISLNIWILLANSDTFRKNKMAWWQRSITSMSDWQWQRNTSPPHTRLQAMETWYQAYQSAHPFLPDPDVLMKYLRLKDQEISARDKNAMLNADDLATIFTTKTAQFEHAVELLAAVQNDVDSVKSSFSSAKAFWSQTNLTEEQLFGEIAWLKEQTVVDLTDDLLFDDAEESAMLIRREAKNVQQFMDTFQQSSREIKAERAHSNDQR